MPPPGRRRLSARRRHEPAGHRPRHDARAPRSTRSTHGRRRGLPARRDRRLPARRRRRLRLPQAAARACCSTPPSAGTSTSAASVMVGDRWRDIEAGRARRRRARSSSTTATTSSVRATPDHVVAEPAAAADLILLGAVRVTQPAHGRRSTTGRRTGASTPTPRATTRRRSTGAGSSVDRRPRTARPARVLDIGSGQGDLLADARASAGPTPSSPGSS